MTQSGEAANQKSGSNQQHQGECSLSDHESMASPVSPARRSAAPFAKICEVGRRCTNGRNQAASHRRQDGYSERIQEQPHVDSNIFNPWNTLRRCFEKKTKACCG